MGNRLIRFSKPAGTAADYIKLHSDRADRMEARALKLKDINADLLAALEKLIEFAQPALEAQGFGYMGSFEQARAAIAKAKGQQLT